MMRNDDPAVYGTLFCAHTANINDAYSVKHRILWNTLESKFQPWHYPLCPASPLCPPPGWRLRWPQWGSKYILSMRAFHMDSLFSISTLETQENSILLESWKYSRKPRISTKIFELYEKYLQVWHSVWDGARCPAVARGGPARDWADVSVRDSGAGSETRARGRSCHVTTRGHQRYIVEYLNE